MSSCLCSPVRAHGGSAERGMAVTYGQSPWGRWSPTPLSEEEQCLGLGPCGHGEGGTVTASGIVIKPVWSREAGTGGLGEVLCCFALLHTPPLFFQRGSDELFSACVSNGPFIMSSNSASAGNPERSPWFWLGGVFLPSIRACSAALEDTWVNWSWLFRPGARFVLT